MSHVFMSYSRRDTAVVDSIVERLEKAGLKVWIDREGIEAGRQWRAQIVEAIDTAEAFVLSVSENSIASVNVLKELNINPNRIKLEWFSTGESAKLSRAIDNFLKDLEKIGPINKMEEKKLEAKI